MGITNYKSSAVCDIYSRTEYCGCVVNALTVYFGGPVFKSQPRGHLANSIVLANCSQIKQEMEENLNKRLQPLPLFSNLFLTFIAS
jgi:hypothetical protein